jgi:nucleoside-diphosphate-sugar epimerase
MINSIRRALVTGASGFIGTALCGKLTASRVEVHGVSRDPPVAGDSQHWRHMNDDAQTSKIHWWKADLVDLESARSLIRDIRPDATFHLGSLVTGSRSLEVLLPIFKNNFMTTLNLLISVAENNAGRIVLAGSLEEPDELDSVPCSPYAAAKWSASGYARMFHALYEVPVVTAKIFMVYGPGQWDHTKLIPYVTTSLLRGERPILSSGVRLVDWIYVDDVVDGLIRCGQTPGIEGRTVELGSGKMHSIREIVECLVDLVPCSVEPLFGAVPERPLERNKKADIAGSHELIGWQPTISLGAGLTRTVEWYEKRLNCFDALTKSSKPQSPSWRSCHAIRA